MLKKRRIRKWLLVFLILFGMFGGVDAAEVLEQEQCIVPPEQVIDGDLFLVCGELRIEGRVEGNLIGIARDAVITGDVSGGIYLAGLELDFRGVVQNGLHYVGVALNIRPEAIFEANSGIIAASLSNQIEQGTRIPGSVVSIGYQLIVEGEVGQEVNFWGSGLEIGGDVRRNVTARVSGDTTEGVATQIERLLLPFSIDINLIDPGLRLTETGILRGDLDYTGPSVARIDGILQGESRHTNTSEPFPAVEPTAEGITQYLRSVLDEFLTLGVIGVIGLLLIPRQMQMPIQPMQLRPISTFGVGMLSFILSFPIFLIFLLISLFIVVIVMRVLPLDDIVLIAGIVLGLANIGGAGLFYFTAIYISRVIFGLAVGRFLLRIFDYDDRRTLGIFAGLGIGVLLVSLGSALPFIGWIINAIALFFGLGAILSVLRAQVRRVREAVSASPRPPQQEPVTVLPYFPEESRHFAPPQVNRRPAPPGMENLPPGFDWWGELDDDD